MAKPNNWREASGVTGGSAPPSLGLCGVANIGAWEPRTLRAKNHHTPYKRNSISGSTRPGMEPDGVSPMTLNPIAS